MKITSIDLVKTDLGKASQREALDEEKSAGFERELERVHKEADEGKGRKIEEDLDSSEAAMQSLDEPTQSPAESVLQAENKDAAELGAAFQLGGGAPELAKGGAEKALSFGQVLYESGWSAQAEGSKKALFEPGHGRAAKVQLNPIGQSSGERSHLFLAKEPAAQPPLSKGLQRKATDLALAKPGGAEAVEAGRMRGQVLLSQAMSTKATGRLAQAPMENQGEQIGRAAALLSQPQQATGVQAKRAGAAAPVVQAKAEGKPESLGQQAHLQPAQAKLTQAQLTQASHTQAQLTQELPEPNSFTDGQEFDPDLNQKSMAQASLSRAQVKAYQGREGRTKRGPELGPVKQGQSPASPNEALAADLQLAAMSSVEEGERPDQQERQPVAKVKASSSFAQRSTQNSWRPAENATEAKAAGTDPELEEIAGQKNKISAPISPLAAKSKGARPSSSMDLTSFSATIQNGSKVASKSSIGAASAVKTFSAQELKDAGPSLKLLLARGGGQAQIQIGEGAQRLSVYLTVEEGRAKVKMQSQDRRVLEQVDGVSRDLVRALRQAGLEIQQVDVQTEVDQGGQGGSQREAEEAAESTQGADRQVEPKEESAPQPNDSVGRLAGGRFYIVA